MWGQCECTKTFVSQGNAFTRNPVTVAKLWNYVHFDDDWKWKKYSCKRSDVGKEIIRGYYERIVSHVLDKNFCLPLAVFFFYFEDAVTVDVNFTRFLINFERKWKAEEPWSFKRHESEAMMTQCETFLKIVSRHFYHFASLICHFGFHCSRNFLFSTPTMIVVQFLVIFIKHLNRITISYSVNCK